jgi:Zn-dependent M28 family amino/carboxypeptidase
MNKLTRFSVPHAVLCLATILQAQTPAPRAAPRERQFKETVYFPTAADPAWPLAAEDKPYAAINGDHLLTYVKELADIAEHYRNQGHQYWGRITGTPADAETAQWIQTKLKQIGVTDIHSESLDLPPQWMPASWDVSATSPGQTVKLDTATPMVRTPGTPNGASLDLDVVYAGLGTAADFIGRDVKGKAVFIQAEALPGAWQQSASVYDAPRRAQEKGAAAIFLVVDLPGNFRTEIAAATTVPTFTLGYQDGAAVRALIEKDAAPKIHVRSDIKMESGQKTSLVWGVIPGMSDEKIIINAHRDGYYDAADDNGTGVATALGLAEYYVKLPKEQRRRTIVIVSNPGHHNTAVGSQWLVAHKDTFFAKAALIINAEHTAQTAVDLYGYKLVATNMPANFDWYTHGSPKFRTLVTAAWDRFGVSRYAEPTEHANGDMGSFSEFGPSLQLIQATQFYHSDKDTVQTIPTSGLAAVTRSYARIIDDVNKLSLQDLSGN